MRQSEHTLNEPRLLRKTEAAALLSVSLRSLERLVSDGLPVVKIGGELRFSPDQLNEWITARRQR